METRTLTIEHKRADTTARTVPVSISSDTPYEREFGMEILDHRPERPCLNGSGLPVPWLGSPLSISFSRRQSALCSLLSVLRVCS